MKTELRRAVGEDCQRLVASLREVDLVAMAHYGMEPLELVRWTTWASAECWTGLINEEIACMVFIQHINMMLGSAEVGVLVTPVADEHWLVFARQTRVFFDELRKRYSAMYGTIDMDYERSRRWLEWLGFTVEPTGHFYLGRT